MSLVLLKQQAVLNKTVEPAEDEEIRQHLAGSISGPAHARDVGDMLVQPLPAPLRGSHWVTPEQYEEEPSALPWLASRHCAAIAPSKRGQGSPSKQGAQNNLCALVLSDAENWGSPAAGVPLRAGP